MAWIQRSADNAWYEDQALTRTAPSAATDGVPLNDLAAVTVVVRSDDGVHTLTAGNIRCYIYDPLLSGWARVPECDLAISTSGLVRIGFASLAVAPRVGGRVDFVTDTVTVSAGTTVRVNILGTV